MEQQQQARRPIRAVLLDVDGTLIDSTDAHVETWCKVFKGAGREIEPEKVRLQMGKGGDQLLPVFFPPEELKDRSAVLDKQHSKIFAEEWMPGLKAFPKTREFVERVLGDGKKVILASSAGTEELETYKRLARIEDLVHESTSADDVECSKPSPDIFQSALAKLDGISAEDAVVIGDSVFDADAASAAGVRCIGLLSSGFPEEALRAAGCIAIYQDVATLLSRYDESPLAW